jgi:hypothetical protein
MGQNMTNPSVSSLLWLFPQTLCPLSASINYTVQLNLVLVVHRDSFHTKMQFCPRVSALPNGLHRISVMVSGWFPGDKLITMAIIRGSRPVEGQGKIHRAVEEAYLIISEGLPPWRRLLPPIRLFLHTQGRLCQNVEWSIWLEPEWGKTASFCCCPLASAPAV